MHVLVKLKCIIILGVLMMPAANATDKPLKIRSVFDINSAFCAIKTNGVLGMDNRESAFEGRGFGTASTNSLLLLENGENDITVEIGALGWFSDEKITETERKKFSPNSSCKVDLTAFKGEQSKILSNIKITISDTGIPVATSFGDNKNRQTDTLTTKKVLAHQIQMGHFSTDYLIDNFYPPNMELYQFTQKIHLKGLPDWKWTHAAPFTSSTEQIVALKQAYLELWKLFSLKNKEAIKSRLDVSLKAWALTTGDSVDDIYNDNDFLHDFKDPDFKMVPINWDDYEIQVFNKDRMVRFVNKSEPKLSPLNYYTKTGSDDERLGGYSPIFSFIDGKFVPVI